MCPACLASVGALVAAVASTGAVAAVTARVIVRRRHPSTSPPGDRHDDRIPQ